MLPSLAGPWFASIHACIASGSLHWCGTPQPSTCVLLPSLSTFAHSMVRSPAHMMLSAMYAKQCCEWWSRSCLCTSSCRAVSVQAADMPSMSGQYLRRRRPCCRSASFVYGIGAWAISRDSAAGGTWPPSSGPRLSGWGCRAADRTLQGETR